MFNTQPALHVSRESLGALVKIDSGGQGTVYAISAIPGPLLAIGYSDLVYKEYNQQARITLRLGVLDRMVRQVDLLRGSDNLGRRLAWPLALVARNGEISGFLMQRAPDHFFIDIQLPRGPQRKIAQIQHLLNTASFLTDRRLPVHDQWRLLFLRDVAETMDGLHQRRAVIGDLSPMNLLFSFSQRPSCFFLDCDAMRVDNCTALPQVETPGWEVLEGEARATPQSDAFKLALLAVRIFAGDQESRDPDTLSAVDPRLGRLAKRGLGELMSARPAPSEWIPVLADAAQRASVLLPWQRTSSPPATATGPRRPTGPPGQPRPAIRVGTAPTPPPRSTRRRPGLIGSAFVLLGLIVLAPILISMLMSSLSATSAGPSGGSPGTALVSISTNAAHQPAAAAVVQLLDRHFSAINEGDYTKWSTTVVAKRAADQSDSRWHSDFRSTTDRSVLVSSITELGSGTVSVGLSFVSNQDPSAAPQDLPVRQICWTTTWLVQQIAEGGRLQTPVKGSTTKRAC